MFNKELYIPKRCTIDKARKLTPDSMLFSLVFESRKKLVSEKHAFRPGQFVLLSVLGYGEVPISIASSPTKKNCLDFLVRKVGKVTGAIHALRPGDEIGIRGPYGNWFPLEEIEGSDIVFISGGCGLAPLRAAINYILDKRKYYGNIVLLYGARTLEDVVFRDEIDRWRSAPGCSVHFTVENGPACAGCDRGVVTNLFGKLENVKGKKIFMCGPSAMTRHCIDGLLGLGASEADIFVTLERYMKCGVGKCGHCYIGDKYVCTDGPVFSYTEMQRLGIKG